MKKDNYSDALEALLILYIISVWYLVNSRDSDSNSTY